MGLGERIREFRVRRRLTLNECGERSGLTTSFVSQVERNVVSPSMKSLEKIAKALGTKVGAFFEEEERKDLILVHRAQRRRRIDQKAHSVVETLASGLLTIEMKARLFVLEKSRKVPQEFKPPFTESFGLVLKGKILLITKKG